MTWVAIWLALGATNIPRVAIAIATTITVAVGLLGLWRWNGDQWETRRLPETFVVDPVDHTDAMVAQVDRAMLELGRGAPGDVVVIVAGTPPGTPGSTNTLRVHRLGQ